MSKKIVISILVMLASFQAVASDMKNATILKMMVDTANGDKIFIKASGDVATTPSCATNSSWQFVLPLNSELTKETMTSFLLSAHMAGKKVRLVGNNLCDTYNSIETLRRIEFEE